MPDESDHGWFHCILTTYGSWLPGDPRGFRTRHHREHVEGDYKQPPPQGRYSSRFKRARELQRFPGVTLPQSEREPLGLVAAKHLQETGVEVIALALGGRHLHVQMRCRKAFVINILGGIKRKLWYERRDRGNGSRLWGVGRKIVPIETIGHQRSTLKYIVNHLDEGAWVWCFRDGDP